MSDATAAIKPIVVTIHEDHVSGTHITLPSYETTVEAKAALEQVAKGNYVTKETYSVWD